MSSIPVDVLAGGVIRSSDMNIVLAALRLMYGDLANPHTDYLVKATDWILLVDDSGGNVNITLPPAIVLGKTYLICKTTSDAYHIMILPNGGDLIDGKAAMQMDTQYDKLFLMDDGNGNWMIVSSIGTPH
jgi:hypothetical protein